MHTLEGMRAFLRVAEAGGFTAARPGGGVSTSQMSRLVSELESGLGVRLFHRTTRRVTLTAAGERYLVRVRDILSAVEEAETEVTDGHLHASGTLRIHCVASFALRHLIPLLALWRREHPDVRVRLTLAQRMPKLLEEGHDIAITFSPATQGSGLVVRRIAGSRFILCASPDYLAKRGTPRTPDELAGHDCLNLEPPDNGGDWHFRGPGGSRVIAVNPVLSTNVPESMVRAVAEGMGVGLLFGYSAAKAIRSGEIVRVLPDHEMNELNIFALYPERKYIDAKVAGFLAFLESRLPASVAADGDVSGAGKPPREAAKSRRK